MADVNTIDHTKEIYELIDTALKIGLGALISGFATYFVTKLSHKHEVSKEKLNRKMQILEEVSVSMHTYFDAANSIKSQWFGFKDSNLLATDLREDLMAKYKECDDDYTKGIKECSEALCKLQLLGAEKVIKLILDYDKCIIEYRNDIAKCERVFLSSKEYDQVEKKTRPLKATCYKELRNFMDELK
ncbi:MAG: hypothetical protein C0625_02025 [Arcobacter sp.]|nr:MAG: hypothetical protein C0625_02025 [Arcobacter sp.]